MRLLSVRTTARALAFLVAAGAAHSASAQSSGNGYLFHAPDLRITVRGGYTLPAASSDLFDFTVQTLTVNRSDFNAFSFGAEVGTPITDRWSVTVAADFSHAAKNSSFRHYVDNNNNEITQTTTFDRMPLMVNFTYDMSPSGRTVGKLAWIPSRFVPYVGGGLGVEYYQFHQSGDFVNYQNLNVFSADLNSDAWAPAAQLLVGTDISLTPHLAITTEARYIWAKGSVSGDFPGFSKLDLSGASATVGLTVRM